MNEIKRDLEGRDIVVTGGSGALGGAVLEALIARGARCHVPCREAEVPASLSLASHAQVSATAGVDLADEASTRAYYESLPGLWGSVHLAGGFAMAPIAETRLADLDAMLRLNAVTCFLCCREAVRAMRRTGAGGGRIVNVAARPAVRPASGMVAYVASKAAVAAMTGALAEELGDEGICVNAILPSIIDTPANRRSMPEADHAAWPKPAEIARTIAFLVSDDSGLTSGALVPVYGRA
ncbi:MAG TPA: SDR family NAD(P)-dependent oxidoreductase [Kofleriaceae bacterium]|nr:SDR family NAD(P)-dependent oxidoreductase [Kofleriaceae bacterium]